MNAIQALNLRKPDARNGPTSVHSQKNKSTADNSRFNKRSNMKEILIRNFFRKYPIVGDITDMQQLKIERTVAQEMEKFISQNQQINSKNLLLFEMSLAQDVNLSRRNIIESKSPSIAQDKGGKLGLISQRHVMLNRQQTSNHKGPNQQFQLPSINGSTAGLQNSSSLEPRTMAASNRRSQIVRGTSNAVAENAYLEGKNNGHLRMSHNNKVANRIQRQTNSFQNTMAPVDDKTKSGVRNLSLIHNSNTEQPNTSQYPMSTKSKNGMRQSSSLMASFSGGMRNNDAKPSGTTKVENRLTKLSGQKVRKAPDGKNIQVEDLPSDISDDEWGEIQKFGQKLHEEQIKKQKATYESKRKQVKEVLDQQIKLRVELRDKARKENEEFDRRLVAQARKELQVEEEQKLQLQAKVIEQKKMRDYMLKEVKQKQIDDATKVQNEERVRVAKLAADAEADRQAKAEKKVKERQAAMKVIKDNQNDKKKRMAELEANKKADVDQMQDNIRVQVEKDKAREQETLARGQRIQAVMDRMGDVVRDNGEELRKKQEKAYVQQCMEDDEKAHLADINKKQMDRVKHKALAMQLDQQMREKRMKMEIESKSNKSHMHKMVEIKEADERQRIQIEASRKQKLVDNSQYLVNQMGGSHGGAQSSAGGQAPGIKTVKKMQLGGMMNPEEAKMNRALLKEIGRVKRGDEPTDTLTMQTKNPI